MSLPHNTPPRIGQKFEYCGAVIEYRANKGFIWYFLSIEGVWIKFTNSEFANLNLKALT
jgi:hypothetical protein